MKKKPKLINVGSNPMKSIPRNKAEKGEGLSLSTQFSADEQWSGRMGNLVFTNFVRKYFGEEYDGTIVVDRSDATDEDNEGLTDIVLWRNFSDFLEKYSFEVRFNFVRHEDPTNQIWRFKNTIYL